MSLLTSLISYWKMDEVSGNRADSQGTNTLTDNGSVGSAAGIISNGAVFVNGTNGKYLSHVSNSDLQTGDIDFTFTMWVNGTTLPSIAAMVSKYPGEYYLWYLTNRFQWNPGSGSVAANNFGAPSTGTWYFVVVWHDSVNNVIGIQVNDGTADTASYSAGVTASADPFEVGRVNGTFNWDGVIDEIGFWKRVLTTQEKTDLYNSGAGFAYPFSGGGGFTAKFRKTLSRIGTGVGKRQAQGMM